MTRRRTGRPAGRPRTLSAEQVAEARELHEGGASYRAIGRALSVSRETVRMALRAPSVSDSTVDAHPRDEVTLPTLSQIREQWALDLITDPDTGWFPPTVVVENHPSARRDLSW